MINIINLNISNLASVLNAFDYLKINYRVSNSKKDIVNASHLILPGVGTFSAGMDSLKKNNIIDTLKEQIMVKKKPILGICLGMQMFFENSEESFGTQGLGLLKGQVIKLPKSEEYTIPRIGWASSYLEKDFLGLKKGDEADFYYIHSFYAKNKDKSDLAISTENIKITGAVSKENIFGTQFHPEKSHKTGLKILENFTKI
jgi:glutamine amidotransferase